MKLANSTQFMADDRETVNRAVAGDIIGLYDTEITKLAIRLLMEVKT